MRASALSALAVLLAAGALRADPPGVIERIRAGGGTVVGDRDDPGRRAYGVIMGVGAADADLAGLCELPRLRALDLRRTRVTDEGLRTVAGASGLRYLLLGGDAVTDAGLRHLEALAGLRELDLRGCPNVTAEGVRRLREALPGCEVIR
jgi:hypothetical protein